MNSQNIENCSRCGGQVHIMERWIACVSRSCWQNKDNYPTPSMPSWVNDDIKLWKIPLCRTCQVKGYIDFLTDRVRRSLKFLKWSPVMFVGSIVGLVVLRFITRPQGPTPLSGISYLISVVATMILIGLFLASIIGALFHALRYLFDTKKLRAVNNSSSLSQNNINNAFTGEAQRIINALEKGRWQDVNGSFALPSFKSRAEHPQWKNEPSDQYFRTNQAREILSVAETHPELEKRLSSEWKKLLQA